MGRGRASTITTERSGSSGRLVPFHLIDDRIDRRENGLMTGLFAHRTRSAMLPLEIVKNRSPQDLDRERVVKASALAVCHISFSQFWNLDILGVSQTQFAGGT